MKFDDSIKELKEQTVDVSTFSDPTEGFARVLLHLYRDPKQGNADRLSKKMSESYGKKVFQELVNRAQSVIDMVKKAIE